MVSFLAYNNCLISYTRYNIKRDLATCEQICLSRISMLVCRDIKVLQIKFIFYLFD